MKITFGKYKGSELCELPTEYLTWLDKEKWVKDELRAELTAILYPKSLVAHLKNWYTQSKIWIIGNAQMELALDKIYKDLIRILKEKLND